MLTKTPQQKPPTNQMHHGDVQKRKPFGFDPPNDYSTRILCIDCKQNKLKKY